MTLSSLIKKAVEQLEANGVNNAFNEAVWMLEELIVNVRTLLVLCPETEIDANKTELFSEMINRRANGIPVQYIIGSWDFYGNSFAVGEGVLIPRPETELLVEFAADVLKNKPDAVVLDLCAGSGCVGLSVARHFPQSRVYLLEKSEKAFAYLSENKKTLGCANAQLINGDIFSGFEFFNIPKPDVILSNPPYINSDEIALLQKEVLAEPVMALDGGKDGLEFYRAIAEKWLGYCNLAVAVECGEGQADDIKNIFSSACYNLKAVEDFNGIERIVCGRTDRERK